ncbi:MAG: putative nucleoside-diphosphate sugar epimerase [Candidatus Saccharibacteria bacterium]|nr:putative nucleoside-diphosphate sugar epimerase [Candidatus Saccharibacteria bacterium]
MSELTQPTPYGYELLSGRGEIIAAMKEAVPEGLAELDAEASSELTVLTERLIEVEGERAAAEYDRYTHTNERGLELPDNLLREKYGGKTIAVTGGAGLIGSTLLKELHALGAGRIVSLDIAEPAEAIDGIDYLHQDIRDAASLQATMEDVRPDVVFHLAADKYNHLAETRARHTIATNVMGTVNVLAAAEAAEVPQVVYASTGKATRPYSPDIYASSKKTGEWLMADFAKNHPDTLVSGVRFTHVVDNSNLQRKLNQSIDAGDPVRLHDPNMWFYTQSARESAHLLLLASLEAEAGAFDMVALNNLEMPFNLADLGIGAVAKRGAKVPLYFCGIEAGYEEKAWPGLYDREDAGDVSPLINALEAPQTRQSRINPGVDTFTLEFGDDPQLAAQLDKVLDAASRYKESAQDITGITRQENHKLSWMLLDATLEGLPDDSLLRAYRRVSERNRTSDGQAQNPDHIRTDMAIESAAQTRLVREVGRQAVALPEPALSEARL